MTLVALTRARAKFSEAEREPGRLQAARLRAAQRVLTRAKAGVSMRARAHQDKQINQARLAMVEASDNLESKFSVKSRGVGLELLAMDDESAVLGKVDGNTREHKPRPPGMRLH